MMSKTFEVEKPYSVSNIVAVVTTIGNFEQFFDNKRDEIVLGVWNLIGQLFYIVEDNDGDLYTLNEKDLKTYVSNSYHENDYLAILKRHGHIYITTRSSLNGPVLYLKEDLTGEIAEFLSKLKTAEWDLEVTHLKRFNSMTKLEKTLNGMVVSQSKLFCRFILLKRDGKTVQEKKDILYNELLKYIQDGRVVYHSEGLLYQKDGFIASTGNGNPFFYKHVEITESAQE